MSRVVVNEIEAKVGNDITFNDTVKIDTLKGKTTAGSILVTGEGNSTTTNLQQGLAKHWVKFAPDAVADDSLNNSSITDTATGRFTVTRTNNMSNANYVGQVNGEWTHGSDSGLAINSGDNNTLTTSAYGCIFYNSSFATYDVDGMAALFHGDLA